MRRELRASMTAGASTAQAFAMFAHISRAALSLAMLTSTSPSAATPSTSRSKAPCRLIPAAVSALA